MRKTVLCSRSVNSFPISLPYLGMETDISLPADGMGAGKEVSVFAGSSELY